MKNTQEKKITWSYHLPVFAWQRWPPEGHCRLVFPRFCDITWQWRQWPLSRDDIYHSRDSADRPKDIADLFPTLLRHNVTKTSMAAVTRRHFPDQLSLADGNLEIFSFSAYFSSFFLFLFYVLLLRMVFECLARFKVAFTTLSTAILAKEKCFVEVAG